MQARGGFERIRDRLELDHVVASALGLSSIVLPRSEMLRARPRHNPPAAGVVRTGSGSKPPNARRKKKSVSCGQEAGYAHRVWIDSEETLLRHLDDPAARENRVVDYKKNLDHRDTVGPRDVVETIAGMANADGGQVLIGIDEQGGAPMREIVGLVDAPKVEARVEQAMNDMLALVEPRPRPWVLDVEGKQIVVVDVYPSVRLASLWRPGERNKIMFPVRTGQGTDYMRPGDVEARILSYGPRSQRIVLEQLRASVEDEAVVVWHSIRGQGGIDVRRSGYGATIAELGDLGLRLKLAAKRTGENGSVWLPYAWITPFLTQERSGRGSTPNEERLALLLRAWIQSPTADMPAFTVYPCSLGLA